MYSAILARLRPLVNAQYDWTTGVPDNGNDWRKFRVRPRAPLTSPCFVLCLVGVETEGLLGHQGRAGDHFHCTVDLTRSYSVSILRPQVMPNNNPRSPRKTRRCAQTPQKFLLTSYEALYKIQLHSTEFP